jgi:butyrate kinase
MRKDASDIRAISVCLGKHISVGAFEKGRLLDNNCMQDGEGPFSPSSSGAIPLDALIDLCYSGKYDMDEILAMISEKGGLSAYLEDSSLEYVSGRYRAGDKKVMFLVEAMARSVAREIGAKAAALRGNVEIIILLGPWVEFDEFVDLIKEQVEWISPVMTFDYEGELVTLATAAEKSFSGERRILRFDRDRQEYSLLAE